MEAYTQWETEIALFILVGLPVLFAVVLKFFLGKTPPPKPDQEISDELFDELEENPTPRRRSRKSKKRGNRQK